MSNLTKYDILKLRHLQLLKALSDAHITVEHGDAGWTVGVNYPVPGLTKGIALINGDWVFINEQNARAAADTTLADAIEADMLRRAVKRAATDSTLAERIEESLQRKVTSTPDYEIGSANIPRGQSSIGSLFAGSLFGPPPAGCEVYVEERWERGADGSVRFIREPIRSRPDWITDSVVFGAFTSVQMSPPPMNVAYNGEHVWANVNGHLQSGVKPSPEVAQLLAALGDAIVNLSPAKVD